jgi:MFS transporter, ACS family, DAL5 transporter family protein
MEQNQPLQGLTFYSKLDWRICSWVCVMFFALQLDRGNINQALSDDMLTDIGLSTNQYNYGMTIFYISFLLAELPSQMVSKKLGPDVWVPTQMIAWSLVAASQAFVKGQTGFYVTRALLGLCEGGFIPDAILYLTYFYTSKELPIRLSYFYTSSYVTQILAAFLAAGIFQMRGLAGWHGWQWMFLLEGIA